MSKCKQCGASNHEPCDDCGRIVHIGDWPFCPHGKAQPSKGFEPFFHPGIGRVVTGIGDMNQEYRPRWENGNLIHLQPRDKPESYYREMNQRREHRAEEARRNR